MRGHAKGRRYDQEFRSIYKLWCRDYFSSSVFITSTNYTQAAGSTVVNGALAATGGAIVNIQSGTLGGTGTINGSVMMAGTLKPGDAPGTLTIFGNYEQTSTGTSDELLSPSSHSLLDVNGKAVLEHGTGLEIALLNGFNPIDQTFDIMNYSSLSGVFRLKPSSSLRSAAARHQLSQW